MKDKQTHSPNASNPLDDEYDLDSQPLLGALQESIDWTLDIASQISAPYPEEVEAIERVRRFAHDKLLGWPAQIRIADVLLTFSVLNTAIERERVVHTKCASDEKDMFVRAAKSDDLIEQALARAVEHQRVANVGCGSRAAARVLRCDACTWVSSS